MRGNLSCSDLSAGKTDKKTNPQPNHKKMNMIRILPTDKRGNVYYGPRNFAQAQAAVSRMTDDAGRMPVTEAVETVARHLESAGYCGVAARLRSYYA